MKSLMGWLVIVVVVFGAAGAGLFQYRTMSREMTYELELAQLKREFQTGAAGLAHLDPEAYRGEVGIHLTKYFSKLKDLATKYPTQFDPLRKRKEAEARMNRGTLNEVQKLQWDERIDIVDDLFKRMKSGQYRPLYTRADKSFRFDVYDFSPDKVQGENRVKLSYVHWGAFGAVDYTTILGNFKAEQTKGKPVQIPQIVGEGQPPNLQIDPEKWIKEFPPGMEVGYYDLPQFPRAAEAIELSFGFNLRTVGGSNVAANIAFPAIDVPEAWKVPAGQKWDAQERFASDEELQAAGGAQQ